MKIVVSIILFYSVNIFAGECTKGEILKMVGAGYSKSQVDDICNKTLKNPKCCCRTYYSKEDGNYNWVHQDTDYTWKNADSCVSDSQNALFGLMKKKWDRVCSNQSYCGR